MSSIYLTRDDIEKCVLAKTIIEKEFSHRLKQDQLARRLGINKNKLTYGFRELNRVSIHGFMTKLRLQKAKELLETTDLRVDVIARRLSLHQSNLVRCFQKYEGITPSQWRSNNRNNEIRGAI